MNDLLLHGLTMKKPINLTGCSKFRYFVFAMFLLWFLLLCHFHSDSKNVQKKVTLLKVDHPNSVDGPVLLDGKSEEKVATNPIDNFFIGGDWDKYLDEIASAEKDSKPGNQIRPAATKEQELIIKEVVKRPDVKDGTGVSDGSDSDSKSCSGRYIYIYHLPSRFNEDLLRHCRSLNQWSDMCPFTSNFGFGLQLKNSEKVFSRTGWFETNQFMLEVIFHNKMKRYKCLTDDSSLASAIFVPYYAGLDVARFLWDSNAKMKMKDKDSLSLVKWVRERPEWKRMWGRDHFMVAGRITWDFRRLTNEKADWGNKLMILPEAKNMTMLTIESSPWNNNDFAIPYPTYFHPSNDDEVIRWQNRMKRMRRRVLFSFVGAPRPNMTDSIRREIIDQCQAARRNCRLLECIPGSRKCYKPAAVLRMFQNSVFCLQPSGDSFTRRSTFDSILAGCIPVFFHPGSAYVQYLWHLPKDYDKYSVFIRENKIKQEKASIEYILSRISTAKVLAMRKQVIKLIPRVVYSDSRSAGLQKFEDAFDLTIDGVLERIEKIRNDIREGNNFSAEVEELNWKKSTPGGITEKHEWDPFFRRT